MFAFIFSAIIAYLLGSINSAIIICKIFGLPDPRAQGSGNPGATNVLRVGGKGPAILTLVGDLLKGLIAVILARLLGVHGVWLACITLIVVLGHIFPLFFGFKGGKGVATAFGALLGLAPAMAIVTGITWLVVIVFSRYSSLAALIATVLAPVYILLFADFNYFVPVVVMCMVLIWRHWDNIQRLREGKESKVNF